MVKRALIVGCNYPGQDDALNGCANDALEWKKVAENIYGFEEENIQLMLDTDPNTAQPTGRNIKQALRQLVEVSQEGDVLFFCYSGHGTNREDQNGDESDGMDEAICPTDGGVIIDDDLRAIIRPLNPGCKFTLLSDSCNSGGLLDHKTVVIGEPQGGWQMPEDDDYEIGSQWAVRHIPSEKLVKRWQTYVIEEGLLPEGEELSDDYAWLCYQCFGDEASNLASAYKPQSTDSAYVSPGVKPPPERINNPDKGILLNGCRPEEYSGETQVKVRGTLAPRGLFSFFAQRIIRDYHKSHPGEYITNRELIQRVQKGIIQRAQKHDRKVTQHPGLECSEKNADSPFLVF